MSNPAKKWARVWEHLDAFVEDRRDGRAEGTVAETLAAILSEESEGEDDE